MNKVLKLFLVALLPIPAMAQDLYIDYVGQPSISSKSGKSLNLGTANTSDYINLITDNLRYETLNGTDVFTVGSTGIDLSSTTVSLRHPAYVATPATNLTPVAGTNDFRPNTVVAAAGPTNMAIALPASPTNGETRWGFNASANPVVVAALGTPVMNGGAGRRTVWPTMTVMRCTYSSSLASWTCYPDAAVPTPIA